MIEIVSESEATCRIAFDLNREAKDYEVILFASTYEESNCEMDNDCLFTMLPTDQLPQITGEATAAFDAVSGEWQITIPVADNTDDASDIDFMLSGESQTVVSSSASEVVIQVDNLTRGIYANTMDLYFAVGLPVGYANL